MVSCTIVRETDGWYASIQVDVSDATYFKKRTAHATNAFDLGVKSKAVDATGKVLEGVKPLQKNMRRLKIRQRRVDRKRNQNLQKDTETRWILLNLATYWLVQHPPFGRLLLWLASNPHQSNNLRKSFAVLARLHRKIANTRKDASHKLTTMICRQNQTVVIEDLNVKGMMSNHRLARAISDMGFGMFRGQMLYKAERYGVNLIIADRWFASSKQCTECHVKNIHLKLSQRTWQCGYCGTRHDRDHTAALNLQALAWGDYPLTPVNLAVQEVFRGKTLSGVFAHQVFSVVDKTSHASRERLATRTALPMAILTCKGKTSKTRRVLECGKVTLVNEPSLLLLGRKRVFDGGVENEVSGSGQEVEDEQVCSPLT